MNKKSSQYKNIQSLDKNIDLRKELSKYFDNSIGTNDIKISQFTKYVQEIHLRRFLFRAELVKKILSIHGSIVELGVLWGGSLMSWARLSSIYEPANYSRKIIGFDTFKGFPIVTNEDNLSNWVKDQYKMKSPKVGHIFADSYEDILKSIELFDKDRYYGNSPKVELVKGNVIKTVPQYIKSNPHLIVSLLSLDLDLYKPTKITLKNMLSRMPKGSIVCFDELNHPNWPGETMALMEEVGIRNIRLERFDFSPSQSYFVIE